MSHKPETTTESLAMVGEFLRKWSHMELGINFAIQAATKMSDIMRYIICANMTVREKLNILRTIVDTSDIDPPEEKARLKSTLRDIGEYSVTRNMIAHDSFGIGRSEASILFFTVKAKGNYSLPSLLCDEKWFKTQYDQIELFDRAIGELQTKLLTASFKAEKMKIVLPSGDTIRLTPENSRIHPPQVEPGSDPAKPQTKSQTPEDHRGE